LLFPATELQCKHGLEDITITFYGTFNNTLTWCFSNPEQFSTAPLSFFASLQQSVFSSSAKRRDFPHSQDFPPFFQLHLLLVKEDCRMGNYFLFVFINFSFLTANIFYFPFFPSNNIYFSSFDGGFKAFEIYRIPLESWLSTRTVSLSITKKVIRKNVNIYNNNDLIFIMLFIYVLCTYALMYIHEFFSIIIILIVSLLYVSPTRWR
jgi:hypothetical protein